MTGSAQLKTGYGGWLDLETRRRILVAAFILDTQHSHLFQQAPACSDVLGEESLDLPFPSSTETWNCTDLFTWRDLMMSQDAFSLSFVEPSPTPLDAFQSSLLSCCQVHSLRQSNNLAQSNLEFRPTKFGFLTTVMAHHALSFSMHTPLHALIITASESWLFGTKITDEAVWKHEKSALRDWVGSDGAMRAVWHATRLLRLAFQNQNQPPQEIDGVSYLHDLWCLYIAALICWAFGYGTTEILDAQPRWKPEDAENLAWEYLGAMDVQNWWEISSVPSLARRSTRGLMECVRVKIGDMSLGGLLNGAEDVLFRLVDGESEVVKF